MKLANIDWVTLRGAIAMLCLSLLIGAALLRSSNYFREQMETQFKQYEARFRDVSGKYLAVGDEERIINDLYPRFVELYKHGVIGHEQRLNWVEVLKRVGSESKIPSLNYEIRSREPYSPEFQVSPGAYQIYATTMKLSLGMLHESDLATLLGELDDHAPGAYSVKECTLKRVHKRIERDATRENIKADCDLLWFTINLAGDKEIVLR